VNCFNHDRVPAVGICAVCQKAVCHQCVGTDSPRIVCNHCLETPTVMGFEYRSAIAVGSWPLIHICAGIDPVTMRPRVAKGVIAIGNMAIGGVAIGGLACGLLTLGGASFGLLFALGGAAIGLGISVGGFAAGSIAVGGLAVGLMYGLGGAAFGPATIDARHCDPAALNFFRQWIGSAIVPLRCR
jgi:hypothetical protein